MILKDALCFSHLVAQKFSVYILLQVGNAKTVLYRETILKTEKLLRFNQLKMKINRLDFFVNNIFNKLIFENNWL